MKPKPIVDGPEERRLYCPWWVPAFWRARELKGAIKIWELWDCEFYPGLGRVISEMGDALASAEYEAQKQFEGWKKTG